MQTDTVRCALQQSYRRLAELRLGTGSSGNLSQRVDGGMLITPSGIEPGELRAEQLVAMSLDGTAAPRQLRPSSEWRMHAALYRARADVHALVHCHSRHATVLACAHRPIPALHYMVAIAASDEVPLAPYATFGSEELAAAAVTAMGRGRACLLANHGQLAAGETLAQALRVAVEVEELAAIYWGSLAIGGAQVLSAQQMEAVRAKFAGYGQQQANGHQGGNTRPD
ncbi:MAG: class II aldolase/adducin family protein [Halioglobus sp.]|nr:class II aldolase/adducin family protein [Halioglobus sp.]